MCVPILRDMEHSQVTHRADDLPRAFVVGCQKSGTTWMQALLEAHPEVCSRGEASFGALLIGPLFELLNGYNAKQRAGETNRFSGEDAIEIARGAINLLQRRWVDLQPQPERIRVIADKTPEHAIALDALGAIYPQMKVIHIVRDGRDGVVSGWHHNLRQNEASFRARFGSMEQYTRYFVEHHWIPFITRAQQWGVAHADAYLELRYEHVLESPREHAARIFSFLGVDTSESVIEAVVERTSFKSLSGGRERGETNNASHFRRGTSGGWRDELDQASADAFEALGGAMLDRLGYERAGASCIGAQI